MAETMAKPTGVTAIGTVASKVTGGVRVAWGDAKVTDSKTYRVMSPYSPAVGDRVIALKMSGTYLVLGKISY